MGCLTVRFCLVPPEPCANICCYLIWVSRPETTGLILALPHCTGYMYALLTDPLQCKKRLIERRQPTWAAPLNMALHSHHRVHVRAQSHRQSSQSPCT